MMGWLETVALAAFMAGLMGGARCAAMCGGLVCLLNGSKNDKGKGGARWQFALAYNARRILSYTIAGVLAGSAGQAGFLLRGSIPVQQVFMIAAGVTLCGLVMLAFGLGTLPNMLLMSGLVRQIHQALKIRGARLAVAGMLAAAGLYGVFHGVHPDAPAVDGFFCRVAPELFGR